MPEVRNYCRQKDIYVIQYPGGKSSFQNGNVNSIMDFNIYHNCATDEGSSGSPIIDLSNFRVLGVHKGKDKNSDFNLGTLINHPII